MSTLFFICAVSLLASLLTFFSGFGLGTILMPAFALFFPIELAITLTAIVHFLNNIFKLFLVGKHADKKIILSFGIPAILAAFAGAYLLHIFADWKSLYTYTISNTLFSITPLKLLVAFLLFAFSLLEMFPSLIKLKMDKRFIPFGGLLSGFFGGLSGHQGALRAAFLINSGLTKESFVATGVVIAVFIDVSRLSIYAGKFTETTNSIDIGLLIAATSCAFIGAFIGNKVLNKITLKALQKTVGWMLMLFSVLLGLGMI
jgi:uncharacterized membrane protein YfcA